MKYASNKEVCMNINDSVVLVTGANRGIGQAFVEALVQAGATKIYATARDLNSLKNVVAIAPNQIVPLALDYGGTGLRLRSTLTSELGRRVGDDHALGDIRCLLTYRLAPPCASLSNESSEDGAATPSIIFSP